MVLISFANLEFLKCYFCSSVSFPNHCNLSVPKTTRHVITCHAVIHVSVSCYSPSRVKFGSC